MAPKSKKAGGVGACQNKLKVAGNVATQKFSSLFRQTATTRKQYKEALQIYNGYKSTVAASKRHLGAYPTNSQNCIDNDLSQGGCRGWWTLPCQAGGWRPEFSGYNRVYARTSCMGVEPPANGQEHNYGGVKGAITNSHWCTHLCAICCDFLCCIQNTFRKSRQYCR